MSVVMAIYLRRILRKGRLIRLVAQRNRRTDFSSQKIGCSHMPLITEISRANFLSSDPYCDTNLNFKIPLSLNDVADKVRISRFCDNELNYINKKRIEYLRPAMLYCAKDCEASKKDSKTSDYPGKAEPAQIEYVLKTLSKELPTFFVEPLNFEIFHKNIIFENNIKGTKTVGLNSYVAQMAFLRLGAHFKYAKLSFDVLKITAHPEDGTVRLRWRIRGTTTIKYILGSFKSLLSDETNKQERWIDGFSIFYVRSDGKIHKHIVDKMIPDNMEKSSEYKSNLATKVAVALGLTLKEFSAVLLNEFSLSDNESPVGQDQRPSFSDELNLLRTSPNQDSQKFRIFKN